MTRLCSDCGLVTSVSYIYFFYYTLTKTNWLFGVFAIIVSHTSVILKGIGAAVLLLQTMELILW